MNRIKNKISQSLSLQLLFSVLISLVISIATFFVAFYLNNEALDKTIYGEAFAKMMAEKRYEDLTEYVTDHKITKSNISQLTVWCRQSKRVYLSVYEDGKLLLESSGAKWKSIDDYTSTDYEDPDHERTLTLADGTETQAFLYYYPGDAFYYWTFAISGLIAFAMFVFCFTSFVGKKLQYIMQMKQDLDVLAGGDLNHDVIVEGKDELGELAFGIDQMRRSILQHQMVEDEMRSSSSKLVTAMSHDLRTPLTSLLGYLELLDRGKYSDEDQAKHFIKRSLGQAMRIKTMADQLFEYFLVYSTEWEDTELEPVEADGMLRQIWSEYAFSLESQGFEVATDFEQVEGNISVDMDLIRRVFDNLYSNLLKYADPAKLIQIGFEMENATGSDDSSSSPKKYVVIKVSNAVSPERSKRESTNLGLNTCERIMKQHNGSFEVNEDAGVFEARIKMPLF